MLYYLPNFIMQLLRDNVLYFFMVIFMQLKYCKLECKKKKKKVKERIKSLDSDL